MHISGQTLELLNYIYLLEGVLSSQHNTTASRPETMADITRPSISGKPSEKVVALAAGEAHTLALTGDGCVYSWGRGTFGRLGTGKDVDELLPIRIEFHSLRKSRLSGEDFDGERRKFVQVAAGAYHSLALEDDGSIWCWGYNTYGQLGLNLENSSVPRFLERFLELGSPDSFKDESSVDNKTPLKVQSINAGGMMSLAIDNLGALWIWGNCPEQSKSEDGEFSLVSSFTPLPVWEFHGHTVVKVACGNEHIVALVSAGEKFTGSNLICYSWGNNKHGQLGLGDRESRLRPEVVKTFKSWTIYEVACGAFHTAVLTRKKIGGVIEPPDYDTIELQRRDTVCWTFGLGDNGQLGHGTTKSTVFPEPVQELPSNVLLISVDCGLFHTCVVSSVGDVWSWGMEKGLGLCPDASFTGADAGDAISPLRVPCEEFGSKFLGPVQVVCGAAHTVLAAHDGYKLWAWGRGRSGVLGRGNALDSFSPCIVIWPPLEEDFQEALDATTEEASAEDAKGKELGKMMEMEKKLSLATNEIALLRSKLTHMEQYASILHGSMFGKQFDERDLPQSLQNAGMFDIAKEWESTLESADFGKLKQMEMFYRNMLSSVKDELLRRRIQDLIKDCLPSSTASSKMPM